MAADRNQRNEERVTSSLPVKLGDAVGVTRDISASGAFFEVDESCAEDDEVNFSIELESPGGKMILHCKGTVVRKEQSGHKTGLAVKITESIMEAVSH